MPKIELLVDLCAGQAGSVLDVQDYEFNLLQKLGVAKLFEAEEKIDKKETVQTVNLEIVEVNNLLLNPNGTPVVDDFGSLIPLIVETVVDKPAKKSGKNTNKGG
ncbi:hypothetical protein [Acinetobacter baumannii]|uniref:hypothetical protein n=1 Tax=Acinetobacter baumannii TaxID=470 RepID=UPI000DCF8389|nr:hypothetical protein [Acinetobacter baumannii]